MSSFPRGLLFTALLTSGCDPSVFDARPRPVDAGSGLDAAALPTGSDVSAASPPSDAARDARAVDANQAVPPGPPVGKDAGDAGARSAVDAGDAGDAAVPVDPCVRADQRLSVSAPAVELSRLATSPLFKSRAIGPTGRLGSSDHVWTFNITQRVDTLPAASGTPANHPYVAFDGTVQPWSAAPEKPAAWRLREPDAGTQLPPTMLPLRSGEGAVVSLVPSSLVRLANQPRALLFVTQYDTLTATKVWLATLEDGATLATRAALPLFSEPPLFALGVRVDGDYLNMYACAQATSTAPSRCVAGRVPSAKVDQVAAYEVRTTNAAGAAIWSSDLKSGATVLENVNNDLTVSYNSYLRRFVAVYGEPSANHAVLRTAAQPFGPWSDPVRVPLPAPSALNNAGIREHPALIQNCERRLVISYFAPTRADGVFPVAGDAVLTAIDLD